MNRTSVPGDIDHVIVVVPDLGLAAAGFAALGFTLTPEAGHSAEMGTTNCCVMLQGSYIELMAVKTPTPLNAGWRELLAHGGGVRGLALRCADAGQMRAALLAEGVPCGEPLAFSRNLPAPDSRSLRFRVVRIEQGTPSDLRFLACQHETPDLLWQESAMRHANGARGVRAMQLTTAQPAVTIALLRQMARAGGPASSGASVAVGAAPAPGRLAIGFAGDTDLAFVTATGLPIQSYGRGVAVDLRAAAGLWLDLVPDA